MKVSRWVSTIVLLFFYNMYLQIKKAELVPDARWHHIKITMVWLYDSDWVFTRWVKLNDVVLDMLLKEKIDVTIEPTETTTLWTDK